MLEDPHLKARNMIAEVEHPVLGKIKTHNMPVMFNGSNYGLESNEGFMEPQLGEHNQAILKQILKMDDGKIEDLYKEGVLWGDKREG